MAGLTRESRGPDSPAAVRMSRRMLLIAAICQNIAVGLTFGSFGTLVVAVERTMHVDRGLSTLGAALAILTMGLLSPFLGGLMGRFGLRALLIAGALATAAGYGVAAVSTGIVGLLLAYAILIGPGIALMGLAVPSALVANWFIAGRRRVCESAVQPAAPVHNASRKSAYKLQRLLFQKSPFIRGLARLTRPLQPPPRPPLLPHRRRLAWPSVPPRMQSPLRVSGRRPR